MHFPLLQGRNYLLMNVILIMGQIVEALSTRYLGPDYSQLKSKTTIGLQDLDSLAQRSFPLCMRHLYTKVKEDHHLRHGGRQQLGLFLKGAGLKLEDALAFWRAEFSQKMGVEKFDKEYSYNVRHNYGREGKRTVSSLPVCL
jgi:DNA primase large subunit